MFRNLFGKSRQFKFSEPEDTACMVCRHVLDDGAPVLYVTHDADDGMWQFLCGAEDHTSEDARMVSLGQVVGIDPSVDELHDMPTGMGAERAAAGERWAPFKIA